jgi:uncharacterized protein involved in cysteine biosynthesis
VGFFRGFLAPFRGGVFVARERLWRYLVLPVLLNVALAVGTMVAAFQYFHVESADKLAAWGVLGWIVLAVLTVLGGVVLFIVAQPILSAVFSDRLSEHVERRIRGNVQRQPFFLSTGRALVDAVLKLAFYAGAFAVGLALTVTPLTIVGSLVGVGIGSVFLAYDGFDYPLSRRGVGFGGKWAYLVRHPGVTVGFAIGAAVLYLVPLAFLVAPSFSAAGATVVFLEIEGKGASKPVKSGENSPEPGQEKPDKPIDISAT